MWWEALLSDGRVFRETDPELRDETLSPWRTLERLARADGVTILSAQQRNRLGFRLRMEGLGFPLVCGQASFTEIHLDGSPSVSRLYRFVCRLENNCRVWGIADITTGNAWGRTTPADGDLACPDPLA
jgi:hypothetical protein